MSECSVCGQPINQDHIGCSGHRTSNHLFLRLDFASILDREESREYPRDVYLLESEVMPEIERLIERGDKLNSELSAFIKVASQREARLRAALRGVMECTGTGTRQYHIAREALETPTCTCPEVCAVCGGRAQSCAALGHRTPAERSVKWHECPVAQRATEDTP